VLTEFVNAGASPEILYINKPHIGTFKLVGIVQSIRAKIEALGGEIRFKAESQISISRREKCRESPSLVANILPAIMWSWQ
jgi:uncharacterized FAD-dependent dehydrogenase